MILQIRPDDPPWLQDPTKNKMMLQIPPADPPWLQDITKNNMILQIRPADTLITSYHQEQDDSCDGINLIPSYTNTKIYLWYYQTY